MSQHDVTKKMLEIIRESKIDSIRESKIVSNRNSRLLREADERNVEDKDLSEDDIGFSISPRINAASRMGVPEEAFNLLKTTNESEADILAKHLDHINDQRKGVVASIVKEANKKEEQ